MSFVNYFQPYLKENGFRGWSNRYPRVLLDYFRSGNMGQQKSQK